MKTGSTALQAFFSNKRQTLKKHGIFVPINSIRAGNYLGFSLFKPIPKLINNRLESSAEELYSSIIDEIEASDSTNIILSSEAYFLGLAKNFEGSSFPGALYNVLTRRMNFDFKVVVYLRNQIDFIESFYKQAVKSHGFSKQVTEDIYEFIEEYGDMIMYDELINQWADVFGRDNIIVRVYSKDVLVGKNIIPDFLSIIGLSSFPYEEDYSLMNMSISPAVTEFIRRINRYNPKKNTSKEYNELAQIAGEIFDRNGTSNTSLLNEDRITSIREIAKDSNRNLRINNYIDFNDEAQLNIETIPRGQQDEVELETEHIIETLAKLWNLYTDAKEHSLNDLENPKSFFSVIGNKLKW